MAKNKPQEINSLEKNILGLNRILDDASNKIKFLNGISLASIRKEFATLREEVGTIKNELSGLSDTKVAPQFDMGSARNSIGEVKDEFNKILDVADQLDSKLNKSNFSNFQNNLEQNLSTIKESNTDAIRLNDSLSKVENRAGNILDKDVFQGLAVEGITQLAGSFTNALSSTIMSSRGSEVGTMAGSIMSSLLSGAMAGSAFGPWGIAAGSVIGLVTGIVDGKTKVSEQKDEAFKDYYKLQYEAIKEEQSKTLAQGTEIYAAREQYLLPFSTTLGGSEAAEGFLKELDSFAIKTTYDFEQAAAISKGLLSAGYSKDEIIPLLMRAGNVGAAYGLTDDAVAEVSATMADLQLSETATLESLNILLQRNIPVWEALAEDTGYTVQQVAELASKGSFTGEEAAEAIYNFIDRKYSGSMLMESQTYSGLSSTLTELKNNLSSEEGKGYADTRKSGMEAEISMLKSEEGEALKEAYNQMGQWKAHLENLEVEYQNDALKAILSGEVSDKFDDNNKERLAQIYKEYKKYEGINTSQAGMIKGRLYAEAQAIAQNQYNASYDAQLELKSNLTLAENLKEDAKLNEAYWDVGYQMGVQFSKGMGSALHENKRGTLLGIEDGRRRYQDLSEADLNGKSNKLFNSEIIVNSSVNENLTYGGKATQSASNINYNPYDNFPAILYGGEHVLATQDNRSYEKSGTGTLNITGNNFYIREEADIEKVAKMMASKYLQSMALAQ